MLIKVAYMDGGFGVPIMNRTDGLLYVLDAGTLMANTSIKTPRVRVL